MRRAQSASDSDPGAPGRAGAAACHRDCGQCQWDSDTETQRVRAVPSRSRSEATASHWAEGPRDGRSDSESSRSVTVAAAAGLPVLVCRSGGRCRDRRTGAAEAAPERIPCSIPS
jgi:hypothetical protein